MIPLALPVQERRNMLRAFWFLLSAMLGTALWLIGWYFQMPFALPVGFVAALGCAAIVFAKPDVVLRAYRVWNRRLVRPFADVSARALTAICYFVVVLATARTGSRLRPRPQNTSTWEARGSLAAEAYPLPFAGPGTAFDRPGWLRSYIQWAIASRNFWSVSLIPFLCCLKIVSTSERQALQTNIYTLF